MEGDRDLGDFFAVEAGLNDHFGGEFHSGVAVFGESAKAAINIMNFHAEPGAGHHREHWVAAPAVQEGHGAGKDGPAAGREPATLDEVKPLPEFCDDAGDF